MSAEFSNISDGLNNLRENRFKRFPEWLKREIPPAGSLERSREFLENGINTVCFEAKCPNSAKCFREGQLTFMILGLVCTRSCGFCAVSKSQKRPLLVNESEPEKIAQSVNRLKIKYVVITSVSRDDLPDGGACQFLRTIRAVREQCKKVEIEVLIPDFRGNQSSLKILAEAGASVVGHNLETVKRLYPRLRKEADYRLSLKVLSTLKRLNNALITKSSLMLGLSETQEEVVQAIKDLKEANCDILTLGQYLAPTSAHEPVSEFISPEKFFEYRRIALDIGFKNVLAGPWVRSSYMAEKVFREVVYV